MFTGIIRQIGTVRDVRRGAHSLSARIDLGSLAADVSTGDSVNVDGVCLTVTSVAGKEATFDIGAETLRLTTLGELREGRLVNLELALRPGDRMGGHLVSGHVDGTGVVRLVEALPGEVRLHVETPERLTDMMILKGSVAVDGVSLTIAALRPSLFEVSLIPHTLSATTLGSKRPGDRVNIECDMIGRWVQKLLSKSHEQAGTTLTIERLQEQGF